MKRKARRIFRLNEHAENLDFNGTSLIARCDAVMESVKPLPSLCSTSTVKGCRDNLRIVCDTMSIRPENVSDPTLVHVMDSIFLDLPESFFRQYLGELLHGGTVIEMTSGEIEYTYNSGNGWKATRFVTSDKSGIHVKAKALKNDTRNPLLHKKRRLSATGEQSILILKISTLDENVTLTNLEIADTFFSSSDTFSFRSQYKNCSGNLLTFDSVHPQSPVTDVQLLAPSSFFTRDSIRLAAKEAAESYFNVSDIELFANHVVYCIPPGIRGDKFYASSAVGLFWVVANNSACGDAATMMHEIGHNFGLGHAWQGSMEYGDTTSLMGATSDLVVPSRCFNGQNIWRLGWFPAYTIEIMPAHGPQRVSLASFVDYELIRDDQKVVVKVADIFLVYNSATTFNVGTGEFRDNVTVVKEVGLHSHLLGGLDTSNRLFRYLESDPLWNMTTADAANDTLWNMSHGQSTNATQEPIYIHICDKDYETSTTAHAYTVAIGYDPYPCSATVIPTNPPSRSPAPTSKPTISHVASDLTPTPVPTVIIAKADANGAPTKCANSSGGSSAMSSLRAMDDKVGYVLLAIIVVASLGAVLLFTVLLRAIRRRRQREEEESYVADVIDFLENCEHCEVPSTSESDS